MKLALVLPINSLAGGNYVVYQHGHYLEGRGHEVEIIIVDPVDGLTVTSFPGFRLRMRSLEEVLASGARYDMTVATWWSTFYDAFLIPAPHRAYFCQSDERRFYDSPLDERIPFVELTFTDPGVGIVTEARWIQRWLAESFGAKAHYAPNGVDLELFRPDVTPLAPRGEKVRVLIEGPSGVPFKRVDLAFRVARQVPHIEVWYVSSDGGTHPSWRFDRLFKLVRLQDMPSVYASCDVLLKLSVVEGFFGPPLEMMACGGTAVVSRVTGWDEYIRHQENALAVDMDDEAEAVAALRRLVDDAALRQRLSQEGVRTAQAMGWGARCPLFEQALLQISGSGIPSQRSLQHRATRAVLATLAQQRRLAPLEGLVDHPRVLSTLTTLAGLPSRLLGRGRSQGSE